MAEPDVLSQDALQQLLNDYFKALPGEQQLSRPLSFNEHDNFFPGKTGENFASPAHIPGSVAGSGISPSAINQGKPFNIKEPETSLPDPHFAGEGKIPSSLAGSGVSPSAVSHDKTFNIREPETSLPDPNFASEGKIPSSLAGSGVSPSAVSHNRTFNIQEPQTSHPDPHFAGQGKTPFSLAGSGLSPSAVKHAGGNSSYSSYLEKSVNPEYLPVSSPYP